MYLSFFSHKILLQASFVSSQIVIWWEITFSFLSHSHDDINYLHLMKMTQKKLIENLNLQLRKKKLKMSLF